MSCVLRSSSPVLVTDDPSPEAKSAPSLSKRGVVAYSERSLRSVESGQSPKDVLSGAFEKIRRTASTNSLKRMSLRFARTPQVPSGEGVHPEDWNWRPVGDVASDVMRNVLIAAALAKTQ